MRIAELNYEASPARSAFPQIKPETLTIPKTISEFPKQKWSVSGALSLSLTRRSVIASGCLERAQGVLRSTQ